MRFKELAGMIGKAAVIGAHIIGIYYGWIAVSQLVSVPAGPLATMDGGQQIGFSIAGLTMAAYIGVKNLAHMDPGTGETTNPDHR